MKCNTLTPAQRRSLVSRRNTAKLRLRKREVKSYKQLIGVELDLIVQAVSDPLRPRLTAPCCS